MNREIKFRAWDKRNDEMCEVISFQKPHVVVNCIDRSTIYMSSKHPMTHKLLNLEKVEIMQYTGLNDKNGIEIYEGDVVKYGSQIGEVTWDKFCWNIKDFYESCYDCPSLAFSECLSCEVIGNIHANKDLLT